MGSDWPTSWTRTTLGDCTDQLAGFPFKSALYTQSGEGVKLLRGDNIAPGRIRWENHKGYPAGLLHDLGRYELRQGDIVVAMDRPWIDAGLKLARVSSQDVPSMLVQRVTRLRGSEDVEADFLWTAVRAPSFVAHLRAETTGTAVPHISGKQIGAFQMGLPPVAEQRAIGSVLRSLDDRIESNSRIARTLADILMLVPPKRGNVVTLDSIAAFKNGGALTKYANGAGQPILRIKELKAGVSGDTPRTDRSVKEDHHVRAGDLLFSWSGTLLTHRWSAEDSILNQHVFRVDPVDEFPHWFIEAWIERHLDEFRAIAADKATTMGHIQRRHLTEAEVAVPNEAAMRELRDKFDPLDDLRMAALRESRTLTAIRDALLPKLVSGQIRVPLSNDPEEQVGTAIEGLET